jgi:glycosyltransferase involved in cell wall biosynthesis
MKNNIMFVINDHSVGGAAKMIKYVAEVMSNNGQEVTLLSFFNDAPPSDLSGKIKSINLGLKIKGVFFWRIRLIRILRSLLRTYQPSVLCPFISDVCFYTRISTIGLKVVFVSAERGDPYSQSFFWDKVIRWTYMNSDYCFFQLPDARDYYSESIRNKSFVIPNAFWGDTSIQLPRKRNNTIVTACRFSPEKKVDVLIAAFNIVSKKYPEYKLFLYGEGVCKTQYEEQIELLGLTNKVFFPGYVKDVAKVIKNDKIFVLSSEKEGIPNSLIEALSAGLACVATDCTPGGARFLLEGGKYGIIIPKNEIESMAKAICHLIEDEQLCKQYQETSSFALEKLDKQIIDRLWVDAFNQIIDNI